MNEIVRPVRNTGGLNHYLLAYLHPAFGIPGSEEVTLCPFDMDTVEERIQRLLGRVVDVTKDLKYVTIQVMSEEEKKDLWDY